METVRPFHSTNRTNRDLTFLTIIDRNGRTATCPPPSPSLPAPVLPSFPGLNSPCLRRTFDLAQCVPLALTKIRSSLNVQITQNGSDDWSRRGQFGQGIDKGAFGGGEDFESQKYTQSTPLKKRSSSTIFQAVPEQPKVARLREKKNHKTA